MQMIVGCVVFWFNKVMTSLLPSYRIGIQIVINGNLDKCEWSNYITESNQSSSRFLEFILVSRKKFQKCQEIVNCLVSMIGRNIYIETYLIALKWFALDLSPFVNERLVINRIENIFEIKQNLKIDSNIEYVVTVNNLCITNSGSTRYNFSLLSTASFLSLRMAVNRTLAVSSNFNKRDDLSLGNKTPLKNSTNPEISSSNSSSNTSSS